MTARFRPKGVAATMKHPDVSDRATGAGHEAPRRPTI